MLFIVIHHMFLCQQLQVLLVAKGGFGIQEQNDLATMAKKLQSKGIPVVISNHDTEYTNEVYKPAKIIKFNVQRFISSDTKNRNVVGELLAIFG